MRDIEIIIDNVSYLLIMSSVDFIRGHFTFVIDEVQVFCETKNDWKKLEDYSAIDFHSKKYRAMIDKEIQKDMELESRMDAEDRHTRRQESGYC